MLLFCVSVHLCLLPLWENKCCDSAADSIHGPCICSAPLSTPIWASLYRRFKAFHILAFVIDTLCFVISLLALWSAICFCFCRIYTVSPCDTVWLWYGRAIWYDMQWGLRCTNILCCSPVRQKGVRISISWPTFILHSMRPSLCSTAEERCISQ